MLKQIEKAVEVFRRMIFGRSTNIPQHKLDVFVATLTDVLKDRYENYWFPENPERASAYRCIRINNQSIDPVVVESLKRAKIDVVETLMSTELTIWVDPGEVYVRIGEEHGSIGAAAFVDEQEHGESNI